MKLERNIFVLVLTLALLPALALAQTPATDPSTVNATVLSGSFDIWPPVVINDNDWHNYQGGGLGPDPVSGRQEFVFYGLDEESPSGFRKVIVSRNGVAHTDSGGWIADDGQEFMSDSACTNLTPFGFFAGVGADEVSGNFVGSGIGFAFNSLRIGLGAQGIPFNAGTSYVVDDDDYAFFQRFDRNGNLVSPLNFGRNVPAGTHNNSANYAARTRSRSLNGDVLSNGNTVCGIFDRSEPSAPQEYGLTGAGNINVFSVQTADASSYPVSTQPLHVSPDTTGVQGQDQQGISASTNGWFMGVAQALGGTVTFRRNDGTLISETQDYTTDFPVGLLPGGVGSIIINDRQREAAAGGDFAYIHSLYDNGDGIAHPAYCQYQIDAGAGTATPLRVVQIDDDAPRTTASRPDHVSVSANSNGDVACMYRDEAGAPVVRVYESDGTPITGSFYASDLADPSTDNTATALGVLDDNASVKVAISGSNPRIVCASWITDNAVSSVTDNNYCGVPKVPAISTVARVFQAGTIAVDDWSVY